MAAVVYVLVFDGYADWEPALAMCEVKKSGRFEVRTVGFGPDVLTSIGGLRVTPDLTLTKVTADGAALLILPGGGSRGRRGPNSPRWSRPSTPHGYRLRLSVVRPSLWAKWE